MDVEAVLAEKRAAVARGFIERKAAYDQVLALLAPLGKLKAEGDTTISSGIVNMQVYLDVDSADAPCVRYDVATKYSKSQADVFTTEDPEAAVARFIQMVVGHESKK